MKSRFSVFVSLFFLGFILFFPLTFLVNFQTKITKFLFGDSVQFIANQVFTKTNIVMDFSSDSISMHILVAILLCVSLIFSVFIKEKQSEKLVEISTKIIAFYLAIILLKYGFDKIFMQQFYLPEPNILYTRFGNLDKDILYWSTMGTSKTYSIILGSIEVFCAILLVFRKTRTLGLVFSVMAFLQIIFVNFSFDISVKLFSFILFLMSIFALKKDFVRFYQFFIQKQNVRLEEEKPLINRNFTPHFLSLKILLIGFVLVKILYHPLTTGNINDIESQKTFLHGAFKNLDEKSEIEYLFFHRNHYLILMNKNDESIDFHYKKLDSENYTLENEREKPIPAKIKFQQKDSLVILRFGEKEIVAKQKDWRKMNALKQLFHLSVEGVK